MDNFYRYAPIVRDNETRVLRLAPGKSSAPLRGQVYHIVLDHEPSYEALSYVWGNPEKEHTIHLENGTQILITKSLDNALRDIRHEERSRDVWADGICINQENIEERQQQVSIMGAIYSNASQVLTYIGPEEDDSNIAIDFASELLHEYESAAIDSRSYRHNSPNLRLPLGPDRCYTALKKLILREWSSRSWCAQEFLRNQNLTMLCGRKTMDWFLLPKIVELCFEHSLPAFLIPTPVDDPQDRRECLIRLLILRQLVLSDKEHLPLYEMLKWFHPLRATDPRDKIYALFGLLSDGEVVNIPVDYNCTTEQLYIQVATYCLSSSQSLKILYSNFGNKSLKLPSWVPDWSTWQIANSGTTSDSIYQACGPTDFEFRVQQMAKLEVTGCLVDKITQLSEPIGQYYKDFGAPGQHEWLEKQIKSVQRLEPYPTGGNASDVLWRTLIGNITFDEEKASDEYRSYFDAHRNHTKDTSAAQEHMARDFVSAVRRRCRYRRLCTTEKGYLGGAPEEAQTGDWICMFYGMKFLFVVRETGSEFTYIGHAYIHGLMYGEILQLPYFQESKITII